MNSSSSSEPTLFSAFLDMDVILRFLPSISLAFSCWLTVKMYVFTMCSQSSRGPMAAAVHECSPDDVPLTSSDLLEGVMDDGSAPDLLMEYAQRQRSPHITLFPLICRSE